LDNKAFDIIDARYNHEDFRFQYFVMNRHSKSKKGPIQTTLSVLW